MYTVSKDSGEGGGGGGSFSSSSGSEGIGKVSRLYTIQEIQRNSIKQWHYFNWQKFHRNWNPYTCPAENGFSL